VKKILVGNLPFSATEESIRSLFAPHGIVESVSLVTDRESGRSRGFAFVEMAEEAADKAIAALNGAISADASSVLTLRVRIEMFHRRRQDARPKFFSRSLTQYIARVKARENQARMTSTSTVRLLGVADRPELVLEIRGKGRERLAGEAACKSYTLRSNRSAVGVPIQLFKKRKRIENELTLAPAISAEENSGSVAAAY
jgi:RNA recognition motif-containing protein